jgi:hypothetical protein
MFGQGAKRKDRRHSEVDDRFYSLIRLSIVARSHVTYLLLRVVERLRASDNHSIIVCNKNRTCAAFF